MTNVNNSVRTGSGKAIIPSGLNNARITVITGYTQSHVTTAGL
jgi:hypothetical protein